MSQRNPILAIVALCLLPILVPLGLHYADWRPASAHANGELLQPPRALPATFADADGHWRIAVAGQGPCEADCKALLDVARRIHVAMYKNMPRVKRIWISDDPRSVAAGQEALRSTQPDLVVAALEQNRNALDLDQAGHRLYLIDPQGLVVMRYPALDEPALFKAAFKDLERLLRFS